MIHDTTCRNQPIRYDQVSPAKIVFGWGRRLEAGALAKTLGRRALVVSGSRTLERNGRLDEIERLLHDAGVETVRLTTISREPLIGDVDEAATKLRDLPPHEDDFVLGVGGGSALDLAKALAALATNTHGDSVADFLEGVGAGLQLEREPLPVMALPTTAGTGSEATKNAVISSSDPPFKKSLRSETLVPRVVLVDPELTAGLPPQVTAWSGMDAVTQLIESYLSRRAQPFAQALGVQGLELAYAALPEAVERGDSREARERMAHAALLSGLALANSGLGLAHGVAAALGAHADVPHGLACALMLPAALRANREAAAEGIERLARACRTAGWNAKSRDEVVEGFIHSIEELAARVGIPRRLAELGVEEPMIPKLVKSSRGNSMNGNPRPLDDSELEGLLRETL